MTIPPATSRLTTDGNRFMTSTPVQRRISFAQPLALAQPWQYLPGVELKEALGFATNLADVYLVETGIGIGADRIGMDARIGPARLGHLVLGHQLGELGEVAWQRQQLRGLPGDRIGWPKSVHRLT